MESFYKPTTPGYPADLDKYLNEIDFSCILKSKPIIKFDLDAPSINEALKTQSL